MYSSAYNKLFWGTLFILLKINIGPFDILPDFVGYLILYAGICELTVQNGYFAKGKRPALVLAVVSLKDAVNLTNTNLLAGAFPITNSWLSLLELASMVINIYMIYILCNGIGLVAREREVVPLQYAAEDRLKIFFVVSVANAACFPFAINLSRDWLILYLLLSVVNFIALVLVAALFRKARAQLGD